MNFGNSPKILGTRSKLVFSIERITTQSRDEEEKLETVGW
jgi:hypothetical protein